MGSGEARAGATQIEGVARMAYYCCGVRAHDAAKKVPVCGDRFAALFMDEAGVDVFRRFADLKIPNAVAATRARIIDDWLRDRLLADPDLPVIILGAGFDARGFRMPGGTWTEIDHPALIAMKDEVLPAERAPNPLRRIAVDFAAERLEDKLKAIDAEHPVIVMEGVSMYLSAAQLKATLSALHWAFPRHTLICDLITKDFAARYGKEISKRIADLGASFAELVDDPAAAVEASGYAKLTRVSMMARARQLRASPVPHLLLNTVLKPLRDGYGAYVFEAIRW